jgi:hypothetical protein
MTKNTIDGLENKGEFMNHVAKLKKSAQLLKAKALENDAETIVQQEIGQVVQKLSDIDKKLSDLKYNPDLEPETEALHSLIVSLWSVCKDLKNSHYEFIGKEMVRTGNFILRTLV